MNNTEVAAAKSTALTPEGGSQQSSQPAQIDIRKRQVAVGIGNFMEWFDFAIYGYFAAIIGAQFFPTGDPSVELLASLAVFAVGFVARPLGGMILGPMGDRYGRKVVLVISVMGMGLATALIGLTPSYEMIGVAAPILIVLFRLVQGMMVGGEWSSAVLYLGESAPQGKRALHASLISTTAGLAFLVGTISAAVLAAVMDEAALESWGWRLPFVASFIMAAVAVYIRRSLEDTPVFEEVKQKRLANEIAAVSRRDKAVAFVLTLAFSAVFGTSLYYFITYGNTHLTSMVGMDRVPALTALGLSLAVYVALNPLIGKLSDRIGRRPIALAGSLGLALVTIPVFLMLNTGNFFLVMAGLTVFGLFVAMTAVSNVILLVEVFPASIRSTGAAIGYNVALAVFAGPGPFIAAALIGVTGDLVSPAYYLAIVALLCFLVLWKMLPETKSKNIRD